jgi:WD40 repeat protein
MQVVHRLQPLKENFNPNFAHFVALSADDRLLAVGGESGLWVWELPAGILRWHDPTPYCSAMALALDGKSVVAGYLYGIVRLLDGRNGRELRREVMQSDKQTLGARSLTYSPDSRTIAVLGNARHLVLWRVR